MEREQEPYGKGYNLSMFGSFNILYFYPLHAEDTERWLEIFRGELLQGIPDTQSFASRFWKASSRIGQRVSRFLNRSSLVRKRGSSVRSTRSKTRTT